MTSGGQAVPEGGGGGGQLELGPAANHPPHLSEIRGGGGQAPPNSWVCSAGSLTHAPPARHTAETAIFKTLVWGGAGLSLKGGGGSQRPLRWCWVFRGAEGVEERFSGPNQLVPKALEKISDWPKARKKTWPNLLKRVVVGLQDLHPHWYGLEHGPGPPTPAVDHRPSGAELLKGAPGRGGGGGVRTEGSGEAVVGGKQNIPFPKDHPAAGPICRWHEGRGRMCAGAHPKTGAVTEQWGYCPTRAGPRTANWLHPPSASGPPPPTTNPRRPEETPTGREGEKFNGTLEPGDQPAGVVAPRVHRVRKH